MTPRRLTERKRTRQKVNDGFVREPLPCPGLPPVPKPARSCKSIPLEGIRRRSSSGGSLRRSSSPCGAFRPITEMKMAPRICHPGSGLQVPADIDKMSAERASSHTANAGQNTPKLSAHRRNGTIWQHDNDGATSGQLPSALLSAGLDDPVSSTSGRRAAQDHMAEPANDMRSAFDMPDAYGLMPRSTE